MLNFAIFIRLNICFGFKTLNYQCIRCDVISGEFQSYYNFLNLTEEKISFHFYVKTLSINAKKGNCSINKKKSFLPEKWEERSTNFLGVQKSVLFVPALQYYCIIMHFKLSSNTPRRRRRQGCHLAFLHAKFCFFWSCLLEISWFSHFLWPFLEGLFLDKSEQIL